MPSRRSLLIALAAALGYRRLCGFMSGVASGGPPKRVVLVFPSALEPCAEAVEGFRERLSSQEAALGLLDVNQPAFAAEVAQELARNPSVIVAVGSDAVRAVLMRESAVTTISTMTLEADQVAATPLAARVKAAVYLDIPVRTLVGELRTLFPDKTRVGVIRNPARGGPTAAQIRGQAPETTTLEIADCATPDELLPVFLSFRKKADFVICLPDGALYNGATARPLIMASLENRLPIVGFSPSFVRAGAAVGVYPDYRGIGQQTADLVRRCLEPGDCASWETPKKLTMAVNARVLRMLGMEYSRAAGPGLVIVR
jgi:ABC-type uncharacterized transport system substrate-binding protein